MDRLEQFEKMLADLQAQYADTAARMEKLKAQDKTRTATYRQLMGQKLTLKMLQERFGVSSTPIREALTRLSEEERIIFLRALVSLARADDNFDEDEKNFIRDTAVIFGIPQRKADLILTPLNDDELIKDVAKIKDRQAALQLIKEACLLANSDGDLSEHEVLLIGKIGQAMGVELEKIEQISQWVIDRIVWLEEGKLIFEQI